MGIPDFQAINACPDSVCLSESMVAFSISDGDILYMCSCFLTMQGEKPMRVISRWKEEVGMTVTLWYLRLIIGDWRKTH